MAKHTLGRRWTRDAKAAGVAVDRFAVEWQDADGRTYGVEIHDSWQSAREDFLAEQANYAEGHIWQVDATDRYSPRYDLDALASYYAA